MGTPLALIVGLGNPGSRYRNTRHNAGYWFVDALAQQEGTSFKAQGRLHGALCEFRLADQRLRLLKPDSFMNNSGQAVAAVAHFYRYPPEQILVVHDDIDLPPGALRLKQGGGHGGHNGLRDIIDRLGSRDFQRLRIGVGHPGHRDEVVSYVLRATPADEQALIDEALAEALSCAPRFLAGESAAAMNILHSR